jgi:hypothetical protein
MFATVLHPTSLPTYVNYESIRKQSGWVQEGLDVEVVGREDDLKEHFLVNGDELLVPLADISRAFAVIILRVVRGGERLAAMVLTVFENLLHIQ